MLLLLRALLVPKLQLALENVALRQQVAVLRRSVPRPRVRARDRVFWVLLRRLWSDWRDSLALVQPATVVRWHRLAGWAANQFANLVRPPPFPNTGSYPSMSAPELRPPLPLEHSAQSTSRMW